MVDITLYKNITVIKEIYFSDLFKIDICKSEGEYEIYTVISIRSHETIKDTIEMFSDLKNNTRFSDFVACFSQDGYLYILFKYYKEGNLSLEDISNKSVRERVEIVKNILAQIIVAHVPEPLLYDVLSENNINIDFSLNGKVTFNYFLVSIDKYSSVNLKSIMRKVGFLITSILFDQVNSIKQKKLNLFIYNCENGIYKDMQSVYFGFIKIYDHIILQSNVRSKKDYSKLINRPKLTQACVWVLLAVVSIAIIIFIMRLPISSSLLNEPIDYIGTKEVD